MLDLAGEDAVRSESWLSRLDSINYLTPAHCGQVILSGSHGGAYSAAKAMGIALRGLMLNDAGDGLESAGLAALGAGEHVGLAVATISHDSARIGDADDMLRRGVVSHANAPARAAGVVAGMACAQALQRFAALAPTAASVSSMQEHRHEFQAAPGMAPILCLDSASLIQPADAGRLVVTGSHGGLIGGGEARALKVDCAFAAFNDAGVGCEAAGLGRLGPLDRKGIAAATVAHTSARIGDAMSSLATGILSHVNRTAMARGATPGMPLRLFLERWPDAAPPNA